jgi:saccharopine dehydrogenase (NAD+, L-lysine-forming)
MLYGANGFTGRLIAKEAVRRGMQPILAGRRESELAPLAASLGLEHRCFALDGAIDLAGVSVVLNAAGPYSATALPMLDACVMKRVSYLDLNGDTRVFSAIFERDVELREAGILAVPGVGFDIVPTDCLGALACQALPGATHLELAWGGDFEPSPGTARSMVEIFPRGGLVRERGELRVVPPAYRTARFPFPHGVETAVSVEWGDVVTSWHSVRVPNVIVYASMPRTGIWSLRLARPFLGLWRWAPIRRLADRLIARFVRGPSEALLAHGVSYVLARARRGDDVVTATLVGPEGYVITARAALDAVRATLDGVSHRGAATPSQAFGATFVTRVEGCSVRVESGAALRWPTRELAPSTARTVEGGRLGVAAEERGLLEG